MLITYFDEVKYKKGAQPYYWLGGLVLDADAIWDLEQRVGCLAEQVFGTRLAAKKTEFHASDICNRKKNFKEWADIGKRLKLLQNLIDIIDSSHEIAKIHVRIDPDKMVVDEVEEFAFMFFVERVEMHLKDKKSPGILIGDRENDRVSGTFASLLSNFRNWKTPYRYGIKIEHLIDTVHFTDSAHSRMLQLADTYVWVLQLCASCNVNTYPRKDLVEYVQKSTRLLCPTRYKEWPTDQSWIQTG